MAFNGSGLFVRLYNWVADRNAAIKIRADRMDAEMDGFATGLSNCITRDGQTTVTTDIPFNNKRLTGVADATADSDAMNRQTADARYQQAGGLAAAVGSSALTISLKTAGGNDPSATEPVVIPFRSATAATGTITRRTVTAATSLVISSGSTMGFTNATAGRLWIVAFDDAGTMRLGAVNCRNGTAVTPLSPSGIASSTAEGGAGVADSAGVFYTGTAVTAKAYTVLGYMEWSAGLTTAGTWAIVPTKIETYSIGMRLPGECVQRIREPYVAYGSTVNTGAFGDNKMQNTEGSEYITASVTPASAANVLAIEARAFLAPTAPTPAMQVGIFQDSTAAALSQTIDTISSDVLRCLEAKHDMIAGTASATVFKLRVAASAGATYINGNSAGRRGGGALVSHLQVEEIVA